MILHPERETGLADDVEPEPVQGEIASGEVSLETVPTPAEEEEELS